MKIRLTPQERRPHHSISLFAFIILLLLLILPVCALRQLALRFDWRLLIGAPIIFSACSFLAYRSDKRRAQAGEWRISEFTLHASELIGGWPGAFLAQRKFRHKISKTPYQVWFWIIVLAYQLVAFDFLFDWRFAKMIWTSSDLSHLRQPPH